MTSHVDQQIAARIAAVRTKTQQQREARGQFAERRAAGLEARKAAKLRRRCAVCDRPLGKGRGRACVRNCGTWLCRAPHRPPCNDVHGGQCPNRPTVEAP
ncbi:hypothetical protein HZZ00_35005 [Streptomyces sp. NEAU-sy36]|uniref:hypothetical protein n=1 Tax=unclassified Streptomyces TaxID=2593676 RepID=UPI0015D5AACF|nr:MULTISPECIES: hypothetical protein [unclassified Streptomyces]QLJ05720.1 hypothetical protein HZZ00_35005 [Streptomyces sp. NEAU-sy36]